MEPRIDHRFCDTRSVLARLRALPAGRATAAGQQQLAERQASLLRYLTSPSDALMDTVVADLPRIRVLAADIPTSGLSHWEGKQWVITVNASEPTTRQRFTVLHEFKHIVDHPSVEMLYGNPRMIDAQAAAERAADYFAGCALVPRPLLEDLWRSGMSSESELADRFNVSIPAIRVRLRQTGLVRDRCPPRSSPPIYYRTASAPATERYPA